MMLEGLAAGIVGHIGSQFNFAGEIYNKIRSHFTAGDLESARKTQLRAIELLDIAVSGNEGSNAIKYMAILGGVPVGEARLPNLPLTEESKAAILSAAIEWCKQDELGPYSWSGYRTSPVFCDGVTKHAHEQLDPQRTE